jgi:glycosyltransferase involved in cell wall biosynthesis
MNKDITAIVFTLNEERRIEGIYKNLKDFCEIIVFDGGSTDGTEAFCGKVGIRFISRPPDDSEMRLESIKWVYKNTPTEYVIHVYGAHFYPQPLLERFADAAAGNKVLAVYHDVVIYRYGDVVHRPVVRRIASACVFYKKSVIDFRNAKIHDELSITFNEKTMVRLPGRDELSLHLLQDEDCESFTKKTINYEALEARQRIEAGEHVNGITMIWRPLKRFIYRYFRDGSFMRGSKGLVYSTLNFIYDLNVSIMMWELRNELTIDHAIRKNDLKREELLNAKNKGSRSSHEA